MFSKLDEIDSLVLQSVPTDEWVAIRDLVKGDRLSTVRGALKRLLAKGHVTRKWDGNQRFGRYLYRARQKNEERDNELQPARGSR